MAEKYTRRKGKIHKFNLENLPNLERPSSVPSRLSAALAVKIPEPELEPEEPNPARKMSEAVRRNRTKGALFILRPRELRFCELRVQGCDQVDAYREAFEFAGESANARTRAWRLAQRPLIQAAIYELANRALESAGVTPQQVIAETARIAMTPDHLVRGQITYRDKQRSLELLSDILKMGYPRGNGQSAHTPVRSLINIIVSSGQRATVTHEQVQEEEIAAIGSDTSGT